MANEITVPLLPCASIDDMLTFYNALGFETTYHQNKPNTYAVVRREAMELHFFTMKGYDPAQSYSTCLVVVPDTESLYNDFVGRIREKYGKKLIAGIPRMTALRNKAGSTRGFNVIDPGGNWIRFTQKVTEEESEPAADKGETTKLSRAIQAADLLADRKGDYEAAAKMLDGALAHDDPVPDHQRVQALIMRAGLALQLGDNALARRLLADARAISLSDEDQAALSEDFQKADDVELMLVD